MTGRILVHVVHLLGHGHIHRMRRIVKALTARGLDVHVAHGGFPVEGFDYGATSVTQLPPLRARDATYAETLDETGAPVSEAYKARRTADLLALGEKVRPDLILMEAWPFGRRVIAQELTALCDTARAWPNPPVIVTSVRDILQEGRKPGRSEEARDHVLQLLDAVLVHSDKTLVPLAATFPLAGEITEKLHYTGFIAPEPAAGEAETHDIIVTAGGGAFGAELLACAAKTAERFPNFNWCIATGPDGSSLTVPGNVTLVTRLEGLAAHLARAKLSISQCGYNTAMDVLAARCPAVFVPHDTTGQTEQLRRAQLFAEGGYGICLPQSQLTVGALEKATAEALSMSLPQTYPDLDGVTRTADLLCGWITERNEGMA
jgi:predicted glycosyltransferase